MEEPNMILWVSWMSRWGEPSPTHAYAVGVFDDPDVAQAEGEVESQWRGGKYQFQHSPSHVNLPDENLDYTPKGPAPKKVLVCSVKHPGVGKFNDIHHFVGVFTSEERAREVAGIIYPNWEVVLEGFEVNKKPDERVSPWEESP